MKNLYMMRNIIIILYNDAIHKKIYIIRKQ